MFQSNLSLLNLQKVMPLNMRNPQIESGLGYSSFILRFQFVWAMSSFNYCYEPWHSCPKNILSNFLMHSYSLFFPATFTCWVIYTIHTVYLLISLHIRAVDSEAALSTLKTMRHSYTCRQKVQISHLAAQMCRLLWSYTVYICYTTTDTCDSILKTKVAKHLFSPTFKSFLLAQTCS